MRASILLLGGLLVSLPVHAQDIPALKKGMPYREVRQAMMKQGFTPLRFPKEEQRRRCWGRTDICEAYPETDGCAGTGRGQCQFVFYGSQGSFVLITTVGEQLGGLRYERSSRAQSDDVAEYKQYLR